LFGSVLVRLILVYFYEILITEVSIVLPSATYFISYIKIQFKDLIPSTQAVAKNSTSQEVPKISNCKIV